MRTIKCKRCESRMYEDEDGALYCPSCGWEVGTPTGDWVDVGNASTGMILYGLSEDDVREVIYGEQGEAEGDLA